MGVVREVNISYLSTSVDINDLLSFDPRVPDAPNRTLNVKFGYFVELSNLEEQFLELQYISCNIIINSNLKLANIIWNELFTPD